MGVAFRIFVAFCVPLIASMLGMFGKRLTDDTWRRSHLYLAGELCLSGFSVATINLFDLLYATVVNKKLAASNFAVAVLGIVVFIYVLTLHRDYVRPTNNGGERKKEIQMLAGFGNFLGFAILFAAVLSMPSLT
jgi:hypothetical protein